MTEKPGSALSEIDESKLSQSSVMLTAQSRLAWRFLSFPTVLAGSLVYLVLMLSRRSVGDPDLWWHMRNAQYLLTTGHLPVVDTYSYTVPGATVVPFEWLSEIPYYFAYKWAGLSAVLALVFLLSSAIILGIFRLAYLASNDVKNSFIATIGGALLASISISDRTLLFGWLYLVILLLLLEAVRSGSSKWLLLVPPLFCLWVNTHGSWPMGMVVFGIFIASGLIDGSWGHAYAKRWARPQLRKLFIAAGASVAALFINPFGYRVVFFPFQAMFGGTNWARYIQEFASIDFQTSWGKVAIVLIVAVLLLAVFSRERWRLDEVAFGVLSLYFALTYIRVMFLVGILVTPIVAKRFKLMTPYNRDSDKPRHNAVALAVLLCVGFLSLPHSSTFQGPTKYPEGAVAYMKANKLQGRIFHEYGWGGYLIWNAPELKVFVDGRFYHYAEAGVFKDYHAAVFNINPQAVLDKYKVEYVLMPVDSSLTNFLKSSPAWSVRYNDQTSILLQRSPTTVSH